MSVDVERIKTAGAISALKDKIRSLQWQLSHVWDATVSNSVYCDLGNSIGEAEKVLSDMRETLIALQQIEPENQ